MTNLLTRISRKVAYEFSWRTGKKSYALNDLDKKLLTHFDFQGGFFVEAGANNGIDQSNTLYLERHRCWRGLLVEPIPELAAQCKSARPKCIVENCALVPFGFGEPTVTMSACGLMSVVKGAMKSPEEEARHLELGELVQNIETREVTVPARTLTQVLQGHHIDKVDFLSLDVEGFELQVLQGLDLELYRPSWILVEARYRSEIDDFLKTHYQTAGELSEQDVLYQLRE